MLSLIRLWSLRYRSKKGLASGDLDPDKKLTIVTSDVCVFVFVTSVVFVSVKVCLSVIVTSFSEATVLVVIEVAVTVTVGVDLQVCTVVVLGEQDPGFVIVLQYGG
jgi:hypothetical protein